MGYGFKNQTGGAVLMSENRGLEQALQEFLQDFNTQDTLDKSRFDALLEIVRLTFGLDAVFVLETLEDGSERFYFPYWSAGEPEMLQPGQILQLTREEYAEAVRAYGKDKLCDKHIVSPEDAVGYVLHYGFLSGEVYGGAVVFWRREEWEPTGEARDFLRRFGRCTQLFLRACQLDAGGPSALEKLSGALTRFCDYVVKISIWEDSFQSVQVRASMEESFPQSGIYSAEVAQAVETYIEPGFREESYYRLSAEYIYSHLSVEKPYYHIDYPYIHDGMIGYCRIHFSLLDANEDGTPNGILAGLQDITTRAKGQDLNDMAFSLMSNSYCRIAFLDLNNDSMRILQTAPGEPVDKSRVYRYMQTLQELVAQIVLPEYQEGVLAILESNHLRGMFDRGVPSVELSYQRQIGGRRAWVRAEVVALRNYSPENACAMWYIRNISAEEARKDAYLETVLQDNVVLNAALSSEKQYRLALMADSFFYYTFDTSDDGLIQEEFLSKNGTNIIKEVTGMELPVPFETFCQKWYELYHPVFDKKAEDVFTLAYLRNAFLRNERVIEIEVKQTPPEDSDATEFMEILIVLSEDEMTGHIMACVIWKDISELRQMELKSRIALKEAYELAEHASRAKTEFLSRMSHDIRTPMNAIIGMTAIAKARLTDTERVEDCLQKINVSSRHLLSLINEVLDMSKIESGKVDLNEEPFHLSDLVDNLSLMIRPQVLAKHHTFNIQINNVEHEKVIGDSLRIQQSFVNLMSNAVKYTPDGGKIDLIITEKPCRQHQFACYEFIFQDNGIGMSPEYVERIFEPFSRAEDTRVNKIQGTGLGMAITNNLVRMMNGTIKVESQLNEGSRFLVTIFLRLQDTEEELDCTEFHGLSVLIADSDIATCEDACSILGEMGVQSEWVLTTADAIDKVEISHRENRDYFAIILDWKMPGTNFPRAVQEIRARTGDKMPTIVVSAYDWSDIEMDARSAGAIAFISKPLFKSRFITLFQEILHGETRVLSDPVQDIRDQNFRGKRVLLVEDNDLNAEIANEILSMTGLEVERAENGRQAVEMFKKAQTGHYDLIFMDVQMPVMNGYEAAQAIRRLPRKDAAGIPIVAMTANAFTEDVEMALHCGMNEHVAKPLDLNQLTRTLKHWL